MKATGVTQLTLEFTPLPSPAPGSSFTVARWISNIACPPMIGVLGLTMLLIRFSAVGAWRWLLAWMAVAVELPLAFLLLLMARGVIRDFHIPARKERFQPLAFLLGSSEAGFLFLRSFNPPGFLLILGAVRIASAALFLLITLVWKITGHALAVAVFATITALWGGAGFAMAWLAIPVVAWSRVRLGRHTPAQTFMGSLFGLITGVIVCAMISVP